MADLKNGTEIKVNIPFTYTIGEKGLYSGKILKTIEDCENEVRLEAEYLDGSNISLDSLILKPTNS